MAIDNHIYQLSKQLADIIKPMVHSEFQQNLRISMGILEKIMLL